MNDQPTTWDEFGEMLARAQRTAAKNYDAAADNLMRGARHEDVFPDLAYALKETRADLNNLANLAIRLTPPETPARPLEAVLADIRALGHDFIELKSYYCNEPNLWGCRSVTLGGDPKNRWRGDDDAEYLAWCKRVEDGLGEGDTPLAAAEARLAQIRELRKHATHILAGVGFVRMESGQSGRYMVGELSREGDANPWKVVDVAPNAVPVIEFEFENREEAESCRDALNSGAFAPLVEDPGVQPITGPTDAEEDDRATAEHCPQRPGGHEYDSYHVCVHCEYEQGAEDAELAALARADHERVRMASEGEEA